MKTARMMLLVGLGLSVSACAAVDVPTRNAPFEQLPQSTVSAPAGYELTRAAPAELPGPVAVPPVQPQAQALMPSGPLALVPGQAPVSINQVQVIVPRALKVSERNSYLPRGDIVWREDPIGDRHAQVQTIVQNAIVRGVTPLNGPVKADVEIVLQRFHALTEKARYTTGGVHSITFDLMLKNPATGELLVPARTVRADLDAFGGQQAINAEARGQTQKVRISDHLAEVIRQELSNPEGYKNASLGFYQLLNNL